jgi:hypothetical protein
MARREHLQQLSCAEEVGEGCCEFKKERKVTVSWGKKTEMPDSSKVGGQKFTVKGGIAGFSGGKRPEVANSPGNVVAERIYMGARSVIGEGKDSQRGGTTERIS